MGEALTDRLMAMALGHGRMRLRLMGRSARIRPLERR
jgi:hypothetical protein